MAIHLSLILPAYNEAHRLPAYLAKQFDYLSAEFSGNYEVVVVDDGSNDQTEAVVSRRALTWPQLSLVRHRTNMGKGQALRTGVAAARGDYILIADADGATPIEEEGKLRHALARKADIAVGSRLLASAGIRRTWTRGFSGGVFAWAVRCMLGLPVSDTQCGFKMFRRDVGLRLFRLCRQPGYLIDVELLLHARRLGFAVAEVPINWCDVPGSKVCLFRDGLKMLYGLRKLRHELGDPFVPPVTLLPKTFAEPVHWQG